MIGKKCAAISIVLLLVLSPVAGASFFSDISAFFKKLVVFEYNQRGCIGGHCGTVNYVGASSAGFTFDEYGRVDFNSAGYGENDMVSVQLISQYGRYFCLTSQCGGFSNWISEKGTVTLKTPPPPSTGTILIGSNPAGAQVTIDGASAGTTSANRLTVSKPPGNYQVSITLTGYQPFTQTVSVTAGQDSPVEPTLTSVCNPGYQYSNGLCYPSVSPPSNPPIFDIISWLKSILQEVFGSA